MPLPQRHQDFQVLVLEVANFGFGSRLCKNKILATKTK